jgi:hypothetical protein
VLLPSVLGAEGSTDVGGAVTLGPPNHGALYAAFVLPEADCERLDSAFLLLDPERAGQAPPEPVRLSVRRVRKSWSPRDVGAGDLPLDSLPEARGLIAPPLTARVDVTGLVCNALALGSENHGWVVRSVDAALPLRIATGTTSALPPRLEIYLKPETAKIPSGAAD